MQFGSLKSACILYFVFATKPVVRLVYVVFATQQLAEAAVTSPDGGGASSLVARMSRPRSLLPTPAAWFNKSRHADQLQKELDEAVDALLRTHTRLSQLESVGVPHIGRLCLFISTSVLY